MTLPLTLPPSVTMARSDSPGASAARERSIADTGVESNTRSAPRTANARSWLPSSISPMARPCSRVRAERLPATSVPARPRSRKAAAKEPPIRPSPMIATRRNSGASRLISAPPL